MVSFWRSPGSEHGVGVMLDVGCLGSLLDHTFSNVLCLLFSLSFAVGVDRGPLSHLGFFFYFASVVVPWVHLDDVMLYSCIVWSGECKPTMYLFPYCITWVVCEDYLSCDTAFNAVMPLSRASTHGRYSHIVGITKVKVWWKRNKLYF